MSISIKLKKGEPFREKKIISLSHSCHLEKKSKANPLLEGQK